MDDLRASIVRRVERLERDRQSATAKAADLRAKANAADARAEELSSAIRHLKDWIHELEMGHEIEHDEGATDSAKVSVLPLVKEYLRTAQDFSGADLVQAIQAVNPDLSEPSIRSALSRCKSQGLVDQLDKNLYRPRRTPGAFLTTSTTNVHSDEVERRRRTLAEIEAEEEMEISRRSLRSGFGG